MLQSLTREKFYKRMINDIKDMEFDEFRKALRDGDVVEIYTDGSCMGNPGPGGWGAVFVSRNRRASISGFEKDTTNNRMELMAAITAVELMAYPNVRITLYTDSSYVKNGITTWINTWRHNNWTSSSGKPVKNKDLWIKLDSVAHGKSIEWVWVKGHSDCANNNNADYIAKSAIISSYITDS